MFRKELLVVTQIQLQANKLTNIDYQVIVYLVEIHTNDHAIGESTVEPA
jgi:hypothetical protein